MTVFANLPRLWLQCHLGLCFSVFTVVLCTLLCTGHAQDAVLTIEPSWSSLFFIGEFVTFKCDMNEGKDTDWEYKINKDGQDFFSYRINKDFKLKMRSTGDSGEYQCFGLRMSSRDTKKSNTLSISVLDKSSIYFSSSFITADKPRATLTAGTTIIPVGGSVTLTCSVQSSDGWKYEWFRNLMTYEFPNRDQQNRDIRVYHGGIYSCRGTRGNPVYYTDISDDVIMKETPKFSNLV
ncbi:hypothetical protein ACER0C_002029 [Sarotherodon galilaeus]